MSDEYLWDRSGPPDPDVERLERMLGRLRSKAPAPDLDALRRDVEHLRSATLSGSRNDPRPRSQSARDAFPIVSDR